jgi:hypothetical protein
MGFNKNTWSKDYSGAPGLSKLGKATPKPTTTKQIKPTKKGAK